MYHTENLNDDTLGLIKTWFVLCELVLYVLSGHRRFGCSLSCSETDPGLVKDGGSTKILRSWTSKLGQCTKCLFFIEFVINYCMKYW